MQMERTLLSMLTLGATLITSACNAAPVNAPTLDIPDDVRALVAPTDTLLAYKSADIYGDGTRAATIVVRHPVSGSNDYDFDSNPCELVILREENGTLAVVGRSTGAVDCTYNDVARNAKTMSLNDNLTARPGNVIYVNQKDKGYSSFHFAWSGQNHAWYLQRVTATYPDGVNVAEASASYPEDFAWTTLSSVDPEAMAELLDKRGHTHK